MDLIDDRGIQELAQLHRAEQLGQKRRVKGERRRPLFRQRGIALVHEGAGVIKKQRGGKGRRLLRGDLRDAHAAVPQIAHDLLQRRHIVNILDALAHRFQNDGKGRVFAGDVQELLGALALLP